uniref:hypothetical protein n=1 Tax=Microbacterium sp. BF1 TaxID=2821146 RepID=UPI001C4E1CE9
MRIVLATHNPHKVAELQHRLDLLGEGAHLVERLGNLDAPFGELCRRVPDPALDVGHQRRT